jgi:hypothetical protein
MVKTSISGSARHELKTRQAFPLLISNHASAISELWTQQGCSMRQKRSASAQTRLALNQISKQSYAGHKSDCECVEGWLPVDDYLCCWWCNYPLNAIGVNSDTIDGLVQLIY